MAHMKLCKLCGGICYILGQLGNLTWYRCVACGMQHSVPRRKRMPKAVA